MAKPGTGGCCLDQSMTCRWHLESPKSKVKWNVNSLCAKCWSSNGLPEGKGIVLKFHKSFCNLRPRPCVQLYIHIYIYTSKSKYTFTHLCVPMYIHVHRQHTLTRCSWQNGSHHHSLPCHNLLTFSMVATPHCAKCLQKMFIKIHHHVYIYI